MEFFLEAGGEKEHLFCRISVIKKKQLEKKRKKKTQTKKKQLVENVLFVNVSCKESNLEYT